MCQSMLELATRTPRKRGFLCLCEDQLLAVYPRCRPSKNSKPEGAVNGKFAPEGARSLVAYISSH